MRVERVSRFEDLHDRAGDWDELLSASPVNSIFLTREWFESWWRAFGGGSILSIYMASGESGLVQGVAPMRILGDTLTFLASESVTDYCDFIYAEQCGEEFLRILLDSLRRDFPAIKRIVLEGLRESSPTLTVLSRLAEEQGLGLSVDLTEVAPRIELPASYPLYMDSLSRKNRHEMKRKIRRAESITGLKRRSSTPRMRSGLLFHGLSSFTDRVVKEKMHSGRGREPGPFLGRWPRGCPVGGGCGSST